MNEFLDAFSIEMDLSVINIETALDLMCKNVDIQRHSNLFFIPREIERIYERLSEIADYIRKVNK